MNWFIIILSGLLILDQTIGMNVDVEVNVNAGRDEKKDGPSAAEIPEEFLASQHACQLGCYIDYGNHLLADFYVTSDVNSPCYCMNVCAQKNYTYAGVQASAWCFCGNQYPTATLKTGDTDCYMTCPGAPNFYCGAGWRMNIYIINKGCLPNAVVTAPNTTVQG